MKPNNGGMARWLRLLSLYFVDSLNILVYPSLLFLNDDDGNIKREILIDVHRMLNIDNIDNKGLDEPLKTGI
jgi:hypothetical protein